MNDRLAGLGCLAVLVATVVILGSMCSPCYTETDPTTGYSDQACHYHYHPVEVRP